jgi:hypothetical protein
MTGRVHPNGTVTLYAITAQFSSIAGGEPDPTKVVAVTDDLRATTLPTGRARGHGRETFTTLQVSRAGDVYRGVAFSPCGDDCASLDNSEHGGD